jgi:hypothetical protein
MRSDLTTHLTSGTAKGGGVWTRGGVTFDWLTERLLVPTANSTNGTLFSRAAHFWPQSLLALNPNGTGGNTGLGDPVDSYTPESLKNADPDFGTTNTMVLANNGSSYPHLAAQVGKDGILRLINLDDMSGNGLPGFTDGDLNRHYFNGGSATVNKCTPSNVCRVLGPMATWINTVDNTSWVFASASNSLNAMQLTAGTTTPSANSWNTPTDVAGLCASDLGGCKGGVTVANGVVYFADSAKLYARNAATKEQLWSHPFGLSGRILTPVVANGVLYFGTKAFSVGGTSPRGRLTSSNLAPGSSTSQSDVQFSPYGDSALAIDENVDPTYANHSVIHTGYRHPTTNPSTFGAFTGGPYWSIDTPDANNVTQIVLYNRTDSGAPAGLGGFRILYRIGGTWVMAANYANYVTTAANPVITVPVSIGNPDQIVIQKTQAGYLTLAEVRILGN